MDLLMEYAWPGNIRELQNLIERAVVLSKGPVLNLEPDYFPRALTVRQVVEIIKPSARSKDRDPMADESFSPVGTQISTLEEMARNHVLAALKRCGGVIEGPEGAAKRLGLHPSTLRSRIARLGLNRKSWNPA